MSMKKNFFFLDSENLDKVETNFYGFALEPKSGRGLLCCEDEHCRFKDTRDGCYVIIRKFPEEIIVSQDLNGSYGLYLYQNGDYFALSNSLLLLAETLALRGHRLTLNQDYLDAFLLNGYTMESCLSTPFLEITELMRNVTVRIDRKHKVIEFEDRELYDQTVDIASQEAMDILDEWYAKWTGVIHGLGVRNEHLCVDLSGGFDSRLTFLLFLGARLDKNIIHVGSYESELHTYEEDWKIANEIASRYGFFINTSMGIPKFWLTLEDFLETSLYLKLGFHKQMGFLDCHLQEPLYHFTGFGGENIRHYEENTKSAYESLYARKQKSMDMKYDCMRGFISCLDKSEMAIRRLHNLQNEEEFGTWLWIEGGCRHHMGKDTAMYSLHNHFKISPLLDENLLKIRYPREKEYLLNAMIMIRFSPEIINYRFQGNREIPKSVLLEAEQINKKFQFREKENVFQDYCHGRYIYGRTDELEDKSGTKEVCKEAYDFCYQLYNKKQFREKISKIFSPDVYSYGKQYYETHKFYPTLEIYGELAPWIYASLENESNSLSKSMASGVVDYLKENNL